MNYQETTLDKELTPCKVLTNARSHLLISHSVMSDSLWPWTIAYQAPLSMEFSRQEYCNGWPFPAPGDLPNPGIEPRSPALQTDSLWSHLVLTIIPTRYQYYSILQMRKVRFREIELCKFIKLVMNWSQDPEHELWILLIRVWILISTVLLCDKCLWAAISSSAKLDK